MTNNALAQLITRDGYHTLIAGQTGSGKSVLINNIMTALLGTLPAVDCFVLIDPKRVELARYKALTRVERFATEPADIIAALDTAIATMERRYFDMERRGLTLFDGPRIWLIIDELADLLTVSRPAVLPRLQRIAQLGRAAKITLIAATQAPARKILPAELVLNIPQRIALHCDTAIESRQIIGAPGAELLPRCGYCLRKAPGEPVTTYAVPLTDETELNARIAAELRYIRPSAARSAPKPPKPSKLYRLGQWLCDALRAPL